ncbi:hypothetical protein, partial [Enterococcus faecium]|uniref:hypothetical protein n=1 Tax=Enterococcus faecium TaxID=1352 RepID=UPI0011779021
YMELGPRDKVSQAFWHEWRKGNTIPTPRGDVVYLDLRHLGEKKLLERLPFIYMELGPRDKVSQAFWHEWRKGNTIPTPRGDVVY